MTVFENCRTAEDKLEIMALLESKEEELERTMEEWNSSDDLYDFFTGEKVE